MTSSQAVHAIAVTNPPTWTLPTLPAVPTLQQRQRQLRCQHERLVSKEAELERQSQEILWRQGALQQERKEVKRQRKEVKRQRKDVGQRMTTVVEFCAQHFTDEAVAPRGS